MNSFWHQPVPGIYIDAHPQLDIVNAYVWNMDLGTELSMTIDDPTTPDQLVDYQSTSLVQSTDDPNFIRGVFQISGFTLKPGDVITVSGAGVTIPYTVSDPQITQFDIVNDTVSGEVLPGEDGQVCANLGMFVADLHRGSKREVVSRIFKDGEFG